MSNNLTDQIFFLKDFLEACNKNDKYVLSFQQFIYLCSDKESIKSYLLSEDCYFILSEFYNDSKYRSLLQNNLNIINQITKDIFNLCLRNEAIPRPLVQLSSLSIQIH